jgi:hypothetical protein
MRGLLSAIIFCGLSLLLAESATIFLMRLQLICADCHDQTHGLIMLIMLVCYAIFGPLLTDGISGLRK